jgi:predicted transcriptional regulator
MSATDERLQEQVVAAFTGVSVRELMSQPVIRIPSEVTLGDAQQYFTRDRYTAFPVTDASGRAGGLLSIDQLEKTPMSERYRTPVGERADRDPALLIDEHADVARLLEQPAFARVGRATVIDSSAARSGLSRSPTSSARSEHPDSAISTDLAGSRRLDDEPTRRTPNPENAPGNPD